jgi:hypothetical protein
VEPGEILSQRSRHTSSPVALIVSRQALCVAAQAPCRTENVLQTRFREVRGVERSTYRSKGKALPVSRFLCLAPAMPTPTTLRIPHLRRLAVLITCAVIVLAGCVPGTRPPAEVYGTVYFDDSPFEGVTAQIADGMMT